MIYDYLIVGGGSAGCVLAHRLSDDRRTTVALIEAGPDTPPEHVSDEIYSLPFLPHYFDPEYYWTNMKVFIDPVGNRSIPDILGTMVSRRYEQARVMGGGSTINGQVAIRGLPHDYDEWEAMGAEGWSFVDCLPYFRRLERDADFGGPYHGKEGPIPIHRTFPHDWGGLSLAFRDALANAGIGYFDDCHTTFADGCFPFPKNNLYGHRVSTAVGYLDSVTRLRPNLTLIARTTAERVEIQDGRAVAVYVSREGVADRIEGHEIIVCGGALHSPVLLMRSGIGPAEHLKEHGIAVLADRPGVGANLQEHPLVGIGLHVKPHGRLPKTLRNNFLLCARFSSGYPDCPAQDMKLSVSNRFSWSKIGAQMGTVQFGPNKAFSKGIVRLRSIDAREEPFVSFNLLSDPRDLQRVVGAVRFVHRLLNDESVRDMIHLAFPGVYAEMQRNLTTRSRRNELLTAFASKLVDMGGPARKLVMSFVVGSKLTLDEIVRDDQALLEWVRSGVQGDWHACGTCRMGDAGDRLAVVDPKARVLGVGSLRVVDASIMPTIPCANTNISTIMIAEKISDAIKGRDPPQRDDAEGRPPVPDRHVINH
jgi:5-(hydroxymethyl)furfural/furfural oxidase